MALRPTIPSITRALALVAGIALSVAAEPAAAAVTVGSALAARADVVTSCRSPEGCTAVAAALGGRSGAVGADGVVVRWRVRSATRGTVALQVLRAVGGGAYATVGTAPSQRLVSRPRAGRDTLYAFTARVPVHRGDVLGVRVGRGPAGIFHLRRSAAYLTLDFEPAIAGGAPRVPTRALDAAELLLNDDVDPDADGAGFGVETQDNCPSIPNDQTTNPCPSTAVPAPGTGAGTATPSRATRFRRHKPVRRPAARAVR